MPEKITKDTEQKIAQLQMVEQSLQSFLVQRQKFQSQLLEVESALEELTDTKEAYKIIGNVMVKSNKDTLKKDLDEKKAVIELRIKTLEKQEKQLKEKASSMQSEVMKDLQNRK